jgi:hypothetical protein
VEIEAFGAAHGDAIVVRWTNPAGATNVGLVDGGPAAKYAGQLQPNLDSLATELGSTPLSLEFVCVSHIDDDHIGGIERLFTMIRRQRKDDRPEPVTVKRLWFNSWDQLGLSDPIAAAVCNDPVVGAGVRQGRDLRDIARLLHLDGNQPFGSAVTAGVGLDLEGLRIDVVSPGQPQLDDLLALWKESERDLPVFAAAYRDRKVPNLSSIALLVSANGRTALLTGDARGDHLLAGLGSGGLLAGGQLHVDVLKVPHHGSINNVAPGFFEAVTADRYVVSADGVTHGLPNTACLDLLLAARSPNDEFDMLLTNPMPHIERHLVDACRNRPVNVIVRTELDRGVVA